MMYIWIPVCNNLMTISFDKVSDQHIRRVMIFFHAWSRPTHVNYIIIIVVTIGVVCGGRTLCEPARDVAPDFTYYTATRVIMK